MCRIAISVRAGGPQAAPPRTCSSAGRNLGRINHIRCFAYIPFTGHQCRYRPTESTLMQRLGRVTASLHVRFGRVKGCVRPSLCSLLLSLSTVRAFLFLAFSCLQVLQGMVGDRGNCHSGLYIPYTVVATHSAEREERVSFGATWVQYGPRRWTHTHGQLHQPRNAYVAMTAVGTGVGEVGRPSDTLFIMQAKSEDLSGGVVRAMTMAMAMVLRVRDGHSLRR